MSSWHLVGIGVVAGLTSLRLNLFEHVLSVLGLFDEDSFSSLLNLKPKEVLQLSHHRHLKMCGHECGELIIESFVRRTKDNIINI